MIMVGKNLTATNDLLQNVSVDYLVNAIMNPNAGIESRVRQLRCVYELNPKQYGLLKKQLPYFVCGSFNPPYRKKENFAYTDCFIIDIDKLLSKQLDIEAVKFSLSQDSQVMVCFKSPSEDGLKVMFKLKERCYDAGIYTVFYRKFVKEFALRHKLEQVVDCVTCDVSRACFISIDPEAYYNPQSTPIDMNAYIDINNVQDFLDIKRSQDFEIKKLEKQSEQERFFSEPSDDIMSQIKARLNPKKTIEKPQPEVPGILNDIMDDLKSHIESFSLEVKEITNIQYGKKICCRLGIKLAEVNLFYGKRGFTCVKSTKSATNSELNELLCEIIKEYCLIRDLE